MERQSGFRAKHSCETALNLIIDEWKTSIAKNKVVIAVFLDFKRTFETIDRNILLTKLYYMGIRGTSLEWFRSYFEGRTQRVKIDEHISDAKEIGAGIAQGSVLAALLFILYINDIEKVSDYCDISLLADDTLLTIIANSYNEVINKLNHDLNKIYKWLCMNKLKLNVQKTKWICFFGARHLGSSNVTTCTDVKINGEVIKRVSSTKYLGIFIDEKLDFHDHFNYIQ